MRKIARLIVVVGVAVATLGASPSAQGSTVTLGSSLPPPIGVFGCGEACTLATLALPGEGALVQSPVSGVILRWRIRGASNLPGYALRVLKRGSGLSFTGAGTSTPVTPAGPEVETFNADLPIQAGDYIGIKLPGGGLVSIVEGGKFALFEPSLADGASASGVEWAYGPEFNADVQPAPTITLLSPTSGPLTGGTAVTIAGADFTGVTAVRFGATLVSSFTVDSESKITALSPVVNSPGVVDVSVTTNAGTSAITGDDHFEYVATTIPILTNKCIVPNLKGKKLKAAKKRARKAGCTIGRVKKLNGATARTGEVVKQKPKAGKKVPAGSKIAVTLR